VWPLVTSVALGATFSLHDALPILRTPRSWSRISPLTWRVPLSLVEQLALAVELQRLQLVPLSQLKRYWKPAAVSTEEGSLGSVSAGEHLEALPTRSLVVRGPLLATWVTC